MLRHSIVQISVRERTDCELFYLSFVSNHVPGSDYEKAQEHPQWIALCNSGFDHTGADQSLSHLRCLIPGRAWSPSRVIGSEGARG